MANWEKLNKEFDEALDSMTKEDWKSWYERFKQKQINQNKMTAYQEKIKQALINGALLQCTEGKNYKTWLVYPNGNTEIIRRDSAEKVCESCFGSLVFGETSGIRWYKK